MTVACSSLCFSQQSFERACSHMARMGFKSVDVAVLQNWAHFSPDELANDLDAHVKSAREAMAAAGLTAAALNASAGASDRKTETKRFKAICEFANALEAPIICYGAPLRIIEYEKTLARYGPLLETAQKAGAALAVEAHARTLLEMPEDAAKFCADLEGMRLTLDPSHMWAGENQGAPFDQLYPYVSHTHWRDSGDVWEQCQVPVREGVVDFASVLKSLYETGYRGAYSVEYIDTFPNGGERNILTMKRLLDEWVRLVERTISES